MLLAGCTYIYVIWNTAELGVSFNDVAEQRKKYPRYGWLFFPLVPYIEHSSKLSLIILIKFLNYLRNEVGFVLVLWAICI